MFETVCKIHQFEILQPDLGFHSDISINNTWRAVPLLYDGNNDFKMFDLFT